LLEDLKKEARKRGLDIPTDSAKFEPYRTDPVGYSEKFLGFSPWSGANDQPGQREIFEDIGESVRLQLAGEPAERTFRVEAGHGVGKTIGAAALVNWFFDCFPPSITMTTAPTKEQVELLLWKDVRSLRPNNLGGRVLPQAPRMERGHDWFAYGRTTSDSGGQGSERFQGQHHPHLMFVVDEAEGVPNFVFDAIEAMETGGQVILIVMLANPRTRSSRFHKKGSESGVRNYRLSCLDHPNVLAGTDLVTGAVSRRWVMERIVKWCEPVDEDSPDDYTFRVPYDVFDGASVFAHAGTILKPSAEFCFRVMGVAPANLAGNTFVPPGRYEAALKRKPDGLHPEKARLGIDCSRYGDDSGTLYVVHAGVAYKAAEMAQADTSGYVEPVKKELRSLHANGVRDVQIRVDGSGGFGSGIIDSLKADEEMMRLFDPFEVIEVQFGSVASSSGYESYADVATEMYAEAAESLKGLALTRVPNELKEDLCERPYEFVNRAGQSIKKLQQKEKFKKKHKQRSPDHGDGFCLAAAPDFVFEQFQTADIGVFTIKI
jgi:hypothetical protein